jgi:hypothetical protein
LKEHVLRQHAGWSVNSDTHKKYLHYFGNESNEAILEAYGLKDKNKQEIDKLKPKLCPNCNEQNKIDSKFCAKCRMVLSYDAYIQVTEDIKTEMTNYEKLDAKIDALQRRFLENNMLLGGPEGIGRKPTEQEIQQFLEQRRLKDKLRRKAERKMRAELSTSSP